MHPPIQPVHTLAHTPTHPVCTQGTAAVAAGATRLLETTRLTHSQQRHAPHLPRSAPSSRIPSYYREFGHGRVLCVRVKCVWMCVVRLRALEWLLLSGISSTVRSALLCCTRAEMEEETDTLIEAGTEVGTGGQERDCERERREHDLSLCHTDFAP